MAISESPQFGSVLERRSSEKRVWWFVVPGVLLTGAVIAAAFVSMSRVSGLEHQVQVAQQQAAEAQKTVEQRDKLLQAARADEEILKTAGQGAAVLAAKAEDSPASGVALYHPARHAVKIYAFGLTAPPQGQEYRVEAVKGEGERTSLGALAPDERGAAFAVLKDVPEGATQIAIRLGKAQPKAEGKAEGKDGQQPPAQEVTEAGKEPEGTLVLAGALPKPGEAGVVPPEPQVQARTPRGRR